MPRIRSPVNSAHIPAQRLTPQTTTPKVKNAASTATPKTTAIKIFAVKYVSGESGVARSSRFQPNPRSAATDAPNENSATAITAYVP